MVVILTQDLMMSSSVGAVAKAHSVTVKSVSSIDKAINLLNEQHASLFLVDLQMPGMDLAKLTAEFAKLPDETRPKSIAYAQHVNVELLEQGQQSGFDMVVTRGQLNRELGDLLTQYGIV